jgi:hypothetical protein
VLIFSPASLAFLAAAAGFVLEVPSLAFAELAVSPALGLVAVLQGGEQQQGERFPSAHLAELFLARPSPAPLPARLSLVGLFPPEASPPSSLAVSLAAYRLP